MSLNIFYMSSMLLFAVVVWYNWLIENYFLWMVLWKSALLMAILDSNQLPSK